MENGTVKWFNPTKGYGFIQMADGTRDVFVHITELERSGIANLAEGQKVTFEVTQGPKGKQASNIQAP